MGLRRVPTYTVIRFVWVSAKFGTFTVVSVNGALVEAKNANIHPWIFAFYLQQVLPIYTYDGASVKSGTILRETDYNVWYWKYAKIQHIFDIILINASEQEWNS
jgi:hypothetical protein